MSAILAVVSADLPAPSVLDLMLGTMSARGTERRELRQSGRAVLGAGRFDWETRAIFSGDALVVSEGELMIAADASIYYQADLRQSLSQSGITVGGSTASHLILAAYRRWGESCADHLEGDFAFALWDGSRRTLLCARDFGGKRPFFYSRSDGGIIAGSAIAAIRAHSGVSDELDLTSVAADAAGLFATAGETCFRDIRLLLAGNTLVWSEQRTQLIRHDFPPRIHHSSASTFDDAAAELRSLLSAATSERLDTRAPTSIWLSGGWDSTAVFGAGEHALAAAQTAASLSPVSISYPEGDPGREDELIAAVAAHWNRQVHWLSIGDIPLLHEPARRAAERDEPFAHGFEMGNRALASGSRHVGARVALDGVGGDQIFQVSNVYLADLLRTGRLVSLAREWRAKRGRRGDYRDFFKWALQPLMSDRLLQIATALRRGRPLRGYLERPLPVWLDAGFARAHGLLDRERANTPRLGRGGASANEMHWYLAHPYFPRAFSCVAGFALESGIELRSPLYDRRVIAFAAARPFIERSSGNETKLLLRRALQGLLPAHVLAPRARRTGITGAYLVRSLRRTHAREITSILDDSLQLEYLGIINANLLRRSWRSFVETGGGHVAVNLLLTLHTELWLRARLAQTDATPRYEVVTTPIIRVDGAR